MIMRSYLKSIQRGTAVLGTAFILAAIAPNIVAVAQTTPAAPVAASLSGATIKALQEALIKQGIAVKTDGILNDETRAAIRQYQSQHHLPVTGEPDKATLDKLGVRLSAASPEATRAGEATPPAGSPTEQSQPVAQPTQTPGGMMMSGPMMQGMMQGMMQTMQGMMGMMQGQMQPGRMQGGPMRPPQAQGGMMMNCPMMPGAGQDGSPAMMQMMQGMMQMMQMMQGQMQPGQVQPGSTQPDQMQPGQMGPGQMGPGRMPGGPMQQR